MILFKRLILLIVIIAGLSSCQHSNKPINNAKQGLAQNNFSQTRVANNPPIVLKQEASLIPIERDHRKDSLTNHPNNPFIVVNEIAQKKTDSWINRPSNIKSISINKPPKPKLLAPFLLKRGEFETTQDFQRRILYQEQERLNQTVIIDRRYQEDIDRYNNVVRNYNHSIANERNQRKQIRDKKYWEFVDQSLIDVLGNPTIKVYQYDADKQVFYATLGSAKSNLNQWIKIHVPLDVAKVFKRTAQNAAPVLSFDKNINEQLFIDKISIDMSENQYAATLINKPSFNNPDSHIVRSKEVNTLENYLSIN